MKHCPRCNSKRRIERLDGTIKCKNCGQERKELSPRKYELRPSWDRRLLKVGVV